MSETHQETGWGYLFPFSTGFLTVADRNTSRGWSLFGLGLDPPCYIWLQQLCHLYFLVLNEIWTDSRMLQISAIFVLNEKKTSIWAGLSPRKKCFHKNLKPPQSQTWMWYLLRMGSRGHPWGRLGFEVMDVVCLAI